MPRKPKRKRVVVIADMHCGHRAGLTPPKFMMPGDTDSHIWKKFRRVQEEAWKLYMKHVTLLCPIDCLIVNGDCIDGRGEKSGGVELIATDQREQCKMAADCISVWNAPAIFMTRGTPYHTGDRESWEDDIADSLNAKIGDHEWIDVNGLVIDVKHHLGNSQIPHGRATAIRRDDLWNKYWADCGEQPRGDMLIRSHVHYYHYQEEDVGDRTKYLIITPALQAMGTRYGARRCSGHVSWGVVAFDVDEDGDVVWRHKGRNRLESTKAKACRV